MHPFPPSQGRSATNTLEISGKQSPELIQRLMLLPQMQQSLKVLQTPILELKQLVEHEIEQNVLLEEANDVTEEALENYVDETPPCEEEIVIDDKNLEILSRLSEEYRDFFSQNETPNLSKKEKESTEKAIENTAEESPSLYRYLLSQAEERFKGELFEDVELLIGYVDSHGLLSSPLEEIALIESLSADRLHRALEALQLLSPAGVGAQSLQESLLLQLRRHGCEKSILYRIIHLCYEDLLHRRVKNICKTLGVTPEEVHSALESPLIHLDFRPGTSTTGSLNSQIIVPDLIIESEGGELRLEVNHGPLPEIRYNNYYMRLLRDETTQDSVRHFLKDQLRHSKWLERALFQRQSTLERLGHALLARQSAFFLSSQGNLEPITMHELAEELEVHDSTIVRAVADKYIATPRGIFSLKELFSQSIATTEGDKISSHSVKERIDLMIREEDRHSPLSDQEISERLMNAGIVCARRTVAKYRCQMKYGTASQRRKYS